jgi:tetratricopeptide (TPR) repeat protein
MDVYSYGLLCYWVLFNDHIATKAHFAEGVGRIANLKAQGSLTDTILERIDNIDQSRSTISVLKLFFLGCLSNNREERYQLISRKIALLADTELADEVTVAVANSEHFNFKITDCLDQLLQVEYRIRQKIFQVLKKSLESRCQDCVKNAALQTGLCHCLALGTVKNVHAASEVLIEHGLSKADLNREMNSLQECEFPNRPGRAKWYVEPDLITQYQERGEMEEAIKLHEEEVIALKECLGANHPLVAMTTITLAHILDGAGQTLKALELCTEQCKLVKLRVDEDHYDNFSSLSQMAFYQWKAGYIEDAIVTGEKLVARLQNSKTIAQTDRLSMSSFSNLATAYVDAKQYEQALPMLLKLIELHDNVLGHDHPESLTTRQNLAVCYTEHIPPRFEEALDLQTAVLKAWRQNFGPKHRHTIGAAMVYASMLFREGSDDKTAFDLYEWAMETSKEQFSESNPDTWLATSNYAYMLIRFESVDQAITLLRRSLQKSEELLPHDHPNILDIMLRLSTAYIEQGMYDDAELLLKKVSQSAACMSQTKPTLKLWVWNGLGEIYQHRGVNALAKEAWERVLTSGKQYWGIHHPAVRLAMRYLGVLHIKEGRHDEGIHMLKKVVAWCKQYKGEADWESMHHRAQLGDSYNATGKFAEAQKILSEVFLLAKETLGATEGITIDVQGNLAYALKNSNQTEMAKDLAEDVMQKRISVLGRLHKDTLLSMRNLFCIYLELKLWSEASSLAQGISTALTELGDDLNDDTWQYLLVEFYARSNRLEEGQKYFLERLTKIKEQHGPEAACDTARYCLAYILSDDTNRLCDAAKLMDQVLTYRISQFGEYSSPTCQAAGLLGVILRDKGDLTGAVAMFQQELRVSRSLKDGLNVHDILFASEHLITVYKKLGYTEEIVNVEKAIEDLELG